jgi:hypothetical protein
LSLKRCKNCRVEKELTEFKKGYGKDGLSIDCKYCLTLSKEDKKRVGRGLDLNNPNDVDKAFCTHCCKFKPYDDMIKSRHKKNGCHSRCKECTNKKSDEIRNDYKTLDELAFSLITRVGLSYRFHHSKDQREEKINKLNLQTIKKVLIKQGVKCNITGFPFLPCPQNKLLFASVDRIQSDKGYTEDNVQIIIRFLNYGKNVHTNKELLEALSIVQEGFNLTDNID